MRTLLHRRLLVNGRPIKYLAIRKPPFRYLMSFGAGRRTKVLEEGTRGPHAVS
jgi:hypothetical protein